MAMPVDSPTKSPSAPAEQPAAPKFDAYHPEMPQIPGVNKVPGSPQGAGRGPFAQIGGIIIAVLVVGIAILWWFKSMRRTPAEVPVPEEATVDSTMPAPFVPPPTSPDRQGPTVAATVEELSKPWASKKFAFVKPLTNETVDAIVIKLPGGGLWAFSLKEPYGQCEMEFVTDLGRLATEFGYRAGHPMVVNSCNKTVYDPLKVGPLGGNVWVRGEIVQGVGLRPPIAIDVKVSGNSIIADSIE
jgi:hypothetical protein